MGDESRLAYLFDSLILWYCAIVITTLHHKRDMACSWPSVHNHANNLNCERMWGAKVAVRANVAVNVKSPWSTKVTVPAECRRAKLTLRQTNVQRSTVHRLSTRGAGGHWFPHLFIGMKYPKFETIFTSCRQRAKNRRFCYFGLHWKLKMCKKFRLLITLDRRKENKYFS